MALWLWVCTICGIRDNAREDKKLGFLSNPKSSFQGEPSPQRNHFVLVVGLDGFEGLSQPKPLLCGPSGSAGQQNYTGTVMSSP